MRIYVTYRETSIYRALISIDTGAEFVKLARSLRDRAEETGGSLMVEAVDYILLQVDDDGIPFWIKQVEKQVQDRLEVRDRKLDMWKFSDWAADKEALEELEARCGVTELDKALDLLEELLSITEPLKEDLTLTPKDREAWARISAQVADLREGEDT